MLAPNLSDYFTAEALADFQSSLAPLGEPLTFRQTNDELRGGMTFRSFDIVYPGKRLRLTTYTYPDGKLEQYLHRPGGIALAAWIQAVTRPFGLPKPPAKRLQDCCRSGSH